MRVRLASPPKLGMRQGSGRRSRSSRSGRPIAQDAFQSADQTWTTNPRSSLRARYRGAFPLGFCAQDSDGEPRTYLRRSQPPLLHARHLSLGGSTRTTSYSYDAIGNLTGRGDTVLTYLASKPHLLDLRVPTPTTEIFLADGTRRVMGISSFS